MKNLIPTVLLTHALMPSLAIAQDFDKGLTAAQSGDLSAAFKEWRPLAEQGDATAQYNIGLMYDMGEGVAQDYAEAAKWYRLAAEQGVASAQYNLGVKYENGEGVQQDYAEVLKWYRLAAKQGDASAQNNLGVLFEFGRGVIQDNQSAHVWYNLASANGSEKSKKWRDDLAAKMTLADVSEAQRRARICMASNYQDCD